MGARQLQEILDSRIQQMRIVGAEASLTDQQIAQLDGQANQRLIAITFKAKLENLTLSWVLMTAELYRQFNLDLVATFWIDKKRADRLSSSFPITEKSLNFLWDYNPRVMLINDNRLSFVIRVLKLQLKTTIRSIALIPIFKEERLVACMLLGDSDVYRYDPRREVDLLEIFSRAITANVL